ncbi:gpt [Symbiodinium sp. CCMP2592]|nr:gpt [Symbiodinium sp. CCMP2592]
MDFGDALAAGSSGRSEDSSTSTRELHSQHIYELQLEVNALRAEIQTLRSALQALEESLARAWVNQTGHHQRLSWLEGIIQSLRTACRVFLEPGPNSDALLGPSEFHAALVAAERPLVLDAQSLLIKDLSWHIKVGEASRKTPLLPWETGPLSWIFGRPLKRPRLELPRDLSPDSGSAVDAGVPLVHPQPVPNFARERLRIAALLATDDSSRWEALRKFRTLVLLDPALSQVGQSLAAEALILRDGDQMRRTFLDVFHGKSTATLVKRASSLWRFANFCFDNGLGNPLGAGEKVLYRYMSHLEEHGKPTSASAFLQAWNFAVHTLKLCSPDALGALSARVKGAAQRMYSLKRKLVQAVPLTVKQVKGLEYVVLKSPYPHWRIIAGHLLMCIGSSCRFADSLQLTSLKVSTAQGVTLVEAESSKWKTASRKDQLLPLASLGKFFAEESWGEVWAKEREAAGLGLGPALPAFSEVTGEWLNRPMSTGEATCYLREFMTAASQMTAGLGCHSLKCTVLSWAAKSTDVPLADRRLLGHHIDPGVVSPLTYARDEQTRLMKVVHLVVEKIRKGAFKPDASKVWRLAKLIESGGTELLIEQTVQGDPSMEESDDEEGDFGDGDMAAGGACASMERLSAAELDIAKDSRMHVYSRVVHILKGSKFLCGRNLSPNYEAIDPDVPLRDLPVCAQCSQKYQQREWGRQSYGRCAELLVVLPSLKDGTVAAMNSTIDSEATFAARATELGMERALLDLLVNNNVKTMGALAFVSPYQIGQADEKPLLEALKALIGRDLTAKELIPVRRLWFEASTTVMGELKQKVERNDSAEPVRLAIAERTTRLDEQKKRLVGVCINSESEPSHRLVDVVFQQGADQQLTWLPWEKLTSRAHELTHSRSDNAILFDAQGNMRLTKKMQESQCTLTGELQARQALQRRALAYDLARLCDYAVMETYHEELFQLLTRPPPPNALYVSMGQIREADKHLFIRIAEQTRGSLTARPDGAKPLQQQLELLKNHPQVQFFLMPPQKPLRYSPYDGKGEGKKGAGGKGKGKASTGAPAGGAAQVDLPSGCSAKHNGKPICFAYNRAGCKFAKDGKRLRLALDRLLQRRCFKLGPTFSVCWPVYAGLEFVFSNIAVFANLRTEMHLDPNNLEGTLNFAIALSSFESGQIRLEGGPQGSEALLDVKPGVFFDARTRRHGTCDWTGQRVVLVAFSLRGSDRLSAKVFAGCARLSATFARVGFKVMPFDGPRNPHQPEHPVCTLDLTLPICQQIFLSRLENSSVFLIHFGLPCGTGSRAREAPLPQHLRARGAPQPRPLRDHVHVLGLPSLSPQESARVEAANRLAEFVVQVLVRAHDQGWRIVIENPIRSWMWSVLAHFVRALDKPRFRSWYSELFTFDFDQCCWGGRRRKTSRFLTNVPELRSLVASCQNDHPHEPYRIFRGAASSWKFDTASEAEYPLPLCEQYVRLLCPLVNAQPPNLPRPLVRQVHRKPPLVPEYKSFTNVRPESGEFRELASDRGVGGSGSTQGSTFGVFHSKGEFLEKALEVEHPFDSAFAIDDQTKRNVFELLTMGLLGPARRRMDTQKKLSALKRELAVEEKRFHASLPEHAQKVLKGKNILLWKKLLEETGFPDITVAELMEGVPLVGRPSKSSLYGWKEQPATTTLDDLLVSSVWRNPALAAKGRVGDDPVLAEKIWQATLSEVERGFISGPYDSEEDVKKALGVSHICCSRRFGVKQGAGDALKYRPIDDFKESAINSAYHAVDRLQLHDVDYFVSLIRFLANSVDDSGAVNVELSDGTVLSGAVHSDFRSGRRWLGRCLDLEKAYKQVPILAAHLPLAVIMVWDPNTSRNRYFTTWSMPFGACAAVFGFNRISRSLLHLASHLCAVIGGVYFDDYPMIEPAESSRMCSLSVETLLDSLGWSYAVGDDKGQPFEETFNLLGMRLGVSRIMDDILELENKPSRVQKLVEAARRMAASGVVSKSDSASLHGQLNFMVGFASGRSLKFAARALSNLYHFPRDQPDEEVKSLGRYLESALLSLEPKVIRLRSGGRPVSVFSDASYEDGVAAWGIVLADPVSGERLVAGGIVDDHLVQFWLDEGVEQVISQAEAFALVLARRAFKDHLQCRRCVFYVDNDAARYVCIKASSPSRTLLSLACSFYASESHDGVISWLERVPSASNIADLPSRGECAEAAKLIGGKIVDCSQIASDLTSEILSVDDLPWSLLATSYKDKAPPIFL